MTDPVWITEQEVVQLMSLPEAIEALRAGLKQEAAGHAKNLVKTHVIWGGHSTLHAIGAVFDQSGVAGTKTWAHTQGGAMPLLIVLDANDGSVIAIIEAFALGQMRTGGISGVATDVLAGPNAKHMAMIGTGKQSLAQIAAVAAVRKLDTVSVWSPTPENREALASQVEEVLGVRSVPSATLEDATRDADIVTLATRATSPFLQSEMIASGTHINAVGAITPERSEFETPLIDRAGLLAADSVDQVRRLSSEFMSSFGDDEARWDTIRPLGELLAEGASRSDSSDLTIFKAMGMGISDLSLGLAIVSAAKAAQVGMPIPRPKRMKPRLTAS